MSTVTKSTLVAKLTVDDLIPAAPNIVIVDHQQLLYHIVWSCAGFRQLYVGQTQSLPINTSRQQYEEQTQSVPTNHQQCLSTSIAMMTRQQHIMSESVMQMKRLLTIISHQALKSPDYSDLYTVLSEEGVTLERLMESDI